MEESLKYRNAIIIINVSLAFILGIGVGALSFSRDSQSSVAVEKTVNLELLKDAIAP